MEERFSRQAAVLGGDSSELLGACTVAVAGLGGVGGAAFEALVRCGVGGIIAADCDVFDITNLNRQILATELNVGKSKAAEAALRAGLINPGCRVTVLETRLAPETVHEITDLEPDFVIDAVDTVSAKLALIESCRACGIEIVSCMGTGNRADATGFRIGPVGETAGCGCGLARVMRRELRRRGLDDTPVLYSVCPPIETGCRTPASVSFVPPVAGYLLAGHAVRTLLAKKR